MMVDKFDKLVQEERIKQDEKWGVQRHDFRVWSTILSEENGEVAKASLEYYFGNSEIERMEEEIIQVSAVCKAIWEHIQEVK